MHLAETLLMNAKCSVGLMIHPFLQGKGEFTMEYKEHSPVSQDVQMQLVNTYKANKAAE